MFSNFQGSGSGWTLERNINLQLNMAEYQLFRGFHLRSSPCPHPEQERNHQL